MKTQEGFILIGVLIIVIIAALLSIHVLTQAVMDQRISAGFISQVQMDTAAQLALSQAEQHPSAQRDTWIEVDTHVPGITAEYQLQSVAEGVLLIQSRAGDIANPSQILWQAYWKGIEQSRRRME
jgi:hypothetical protein